PRSSSGVAARPRFFPRPAAAARPPSALTLRGAACDGRGLAPRGFSRRMGTMARLDRQVRRLAGAFALAAASAGSAQAHDVLWWTDLDLGTNVIPGALTLLQATRPGLTFTQATSQGDFNTQLAGGGFELAIFGEQNFSTTFNGS